MRSFVCFVVCVVGMLFAAGSASAQCPGGVCPRPYYVVPQPEPIFRAPVRRFFWQSFKPRAYYYPAVPAQAR